MTDFTGLGVSEGRVDILKAMGIAKPTPVQEETIPIVKAGHDVISQAQTGTGKTLAFVLPMLDKVRTDVPQVQGLILTPTRELAIQITGEIKKLLRPADGIKVLAVYGGQDVEAQLHKLKGDMHLIVATPGRLLDHLRRETISLEAVKMLVLDEADQMLHMGFLKEVEDILRQTPYKKQTMLFSATMPPVIREMAGRILHNPQHVTVKAERVTVKDIRQWVVETSDRNKQETLVGLLEETQPYLSIIFCRTKRRANTLNVALQEMGYASDELHGDLSQSKREQVMKRFRDAKLQLLVATDVAARGLDVEGVTHVFNYDVPLDVESYIHRIGRTGRAGEKGLAITLIAPKDRREFADIENGIQMAMERRSPDGSPLDGGGLQGPRAGGGHGRAGSEGRPPRGAGREAASRKDRGARGDAAGTGAAGGRRGRGGASDAKAGRGSRAGGGPRDEQRSERGSAGFGRGAAGSGRGAAGTGRGAASAGRSAAGVGRGAASAGRSAAGVGRGAAGAGRSAAGAGRSAAGTGRGAASAGWSAATGRGAAKPARGGRAAEPRSGGFGSGRSSGPKAGGVKFGGGAGRPKGGPGGTGGRGGRGSQRGR
ncbi:DEAD/DEAH box helicase [Cohnella cellulosilytica]|uniref:DEAD/DEAH box helicase n=1 Tax=Cohnella cellulosilytica TaxID=986710 RepID=UPI003A8EA1CD